MNRRFPTQEWLALVPVAAILVLVLAMTGTVSAAPAAGASSAPAANSQQQTQWPVCKGCHAVEDAAWEASTHGKAGATCESCHGEYKEGHPNGATMTLPMESQTCRSCHESTFIDWENSRHGSSDVDCFDCHLAHSQGLRLEPAEKLCSACHTDEETRLAHGVHNISGVNCVSCHMASQTVKSTDGTGATKSMSSHDFAVAANICAGCHEGSIHSAAGARAVEVSTKAEETVLQVAQQTRRIAELEQQVNADEQRIRDLRNISVASMGLMLGVGGAMGLIVGVGVSALLGRRKAQ